MKRMTRILQLFAFFFSVMIAWPAAILAQPATSGSNSGEGNATDYMMSYLIVVLGIILGVLVVANSSNRRSRERPAGYVEKNIIAKE